MGIRWASESLLQHADHARAAEAIEAASFILWSLSGQQYSGVHRVTEAYSTDRVLGRRSEIYPVFMNKEVWNYGSSCCCTECGVFHRIRLRGTPVRRIVEVIIRGEVLAPDEYVILDHGVLGFLTPVACCAECVVVTYLHGTIPPGGDRAVLKLADQLLAAECGEECELPQRVTSITRGGTSWTLLDPQDFLDKRRTGIYEIDLFLEAINPSKALKKARVFSPDNPRVETHVMQPPPPAALVSEGDQAVLSGHPSTWVVHNHEAREAAVNGEKLRTRIGDFVMARHWKPVYGSQTAISLVLPPEETSEMISGEPWALMNDCGDTLAAGKVRVL